MSKPKKRSVRMWGIIESGVSAAYNPCCVSHTRKQAVKAYLSGDSPPTWEAAFKFGDRCVPLTVTYTYEETP